MNLIGGLMASDARLISAKTGQTFGRDYYLLIMGGDDIRFVILLWSLLACFIANDAEYFN